MVKKHIILCVFLIIILSAFIFYILFGFEIQCCEHESKYLPANQGEAIWVTEDGDSWFRVDKTEPLGFCFAKL